MATTLPSRAGLRLFITPTASPFCGWRPEFAHAGLVGWLDARPREQWPTLLRGDVAWGTEKTMAEAEKRDLPYLFKLRQSDGVKELMRRSVGRTAWVPAGGGWQGVEEVLQWQGWTRPRRVVVLRRALPQDVAMVDGETEGRQERLVGMVVMNPAKPMHEYAVLVTTAAVKDVLSVAPLYRDRADAENSFDERRRQWAWRGFTTQDQRLGFQLVEFVYAPGLAGEAYGGDDEPADAGVRVREENAT